MTVRRNLLLIMLFTLGLSCLSGCNEANNKNLEETTVSKENVKVTCSKKGYEEMTVINNNCLLVESDNEKFGIIDFEENYLVQAEYEYGNYFPSGELIILGNNTDNYFKILDKNLNCIFENTDYKEYLVKSVSEGIVQLYSAKSNTYIYLNSLDNFNIILELNEENVEKFERCSSYKNGNVIIISNSNNLNKKICMMDSSGTVYYFETDEENIYPYLDLNANDDGWIICYEINKDNSDIKKIFYNVGSKEIKELPSDKQYIEPIKDYDGIYYATSNNIALVKTEADAKLVYAYDIINEKYLNETPFGYVELKDYGKENILYQTASENKWGYLNSNFEITEKKYIDATSYNSYGYAFINKDGFEYLIDLEENKISEAIEGDSAELNNDVFIITRNNKKYFTIINRNE